MGHGNPLLVCTETRQVLSILSMDEYGRVQQPRNTHTHVVTVLYTVMFWSSSAARVSSSLLVVVV